VSIVISQDVPQYKVVYENPFGDDPFFQNVGMQVPVYEPTGQTQSQEVGAGSGYIITSDGYIITNKHVVPSDQDSYTVLLQSGKQETAQVVYRDPNNDLAIVKISGSKFPAISFDDSNSLQLGQTVIAIGNALGQYNNSVSLGVISGLNRTISASDENGNAETLTGVLQTDAAINLGNSGGPLLDLNGNAVGINVATVQGSNNISFSIPSNMVKSIIKSAIGR
jgi:S1-C subfamily serine protease